MPQPPDQLSSEGWIDALAVRLTLPAPPSHNQKQIAQAIVSMARNGMEPFETLRVTSNLDYLEVSRAVNHDVQKGDSHVECVSLGGVRVWYRDIEGLVTILIASEHEGGWMDFRALKEFEKGGYAGFLRLLADRIVALSPEGLEG